MTTPASASTFEVKGVRTGPPFRDRRWYSGYMAFGPNDESPTVLVAPGVISNLRKEAACASPNEIGGLLAGRVLQDARGTYTLIDGAALTGTGRPGSIHLTPEVAATVEARLFARYPTSDLVGWVHSHSIPSGFSNTDRQTQRLWTNPAHIGLLIFASGEPSTIAYVGPESYGMPYLGNLAPRREAGASPPFANRTLEATSRHGWKGRNGLRVLAALAASSVIVMATLLVGSWQLRRHVTPVTSWQSVAWNCQQRSVTLQCNASAYGQAKVQWDQNGEMAARGDRATFTLDPGSTTIIGVTLRTPGGAIQAGSEQFLDEARSSSPKTLNNPSSTLSSSAMAPMSATKPSTVAPARSLGRHPQ